MFPQHFLSKADFTGLILAIGPWILRTAAGEVREWQRDHRGLRLAVNLSPPELMKRTLPDEVQAALEETGFPKQLLQLEVPEGHVVSDLPRSLDILHRLKALGVSLVLDRFAVRYSSLGRLAELPLDGVKLDLAFLRGPSQNPEDVSLLTAVTAVARGLKLRVCAQGVENAAQLQLLEQLGCSEFQGFHLGPPVPPATLADQLRHRAGRASRARADELRRPARDARPLGAAADAVRGRRERAAHAHAARAPRGAGAAWRARRVRDGRSHGRDAGRPAAAPGPGRGEAAGHGARATARRDRLPPARRGAGRDGAAAEGTLQMVVRQRMQELVGELLAWRDGFFRFEPAKDGSQSDVEVDLGDFVLPLGLPPQELLMRAVTALDHGDLARLPPPPDTQPPLPGAPALAAAAVSPTGSYAADFTGEAVLSLLRFASQVLARAVVFAVDGDEARGVGEFGSRPRAPPRPSARRCCRCASLRS